MRKQKTIRFLGDTYQRLHYLRRERVKAARTKVSLQAILTEVLVAGLDALGVPRFPGEVENDSELDALD